MHDRSHSYFSSVRRYQLYLCPCSKKNTLAFAILVFLSTLCIFVPHLRNRVLYPLWPNAWREIGTFDVIAMKVFSSTYSGVEFPPLVCSTKIRPSVSNSDINRTTWKLHSDIFTKELHSVEHQRFLPIITDDEKAEMLRAYLIIAKALQQKNIQFFLVEGSLLGAQRHRGIIPWDDDIDIAISVNHAGLVRKLLGCIEGYILDSSPKMHWKFFPNSTQTRYGFPFIDLFFYTENEDYIWAVTDYLAQTVIFAKKDTFPLRTAQFDGLQVPVPRHTDHILRTLFDYALCQSASSNHKAAITFPSSKMSTIPCSSLSYLYQMYHV